MFQDIVVVHVEYVEHMCVAEQGGWDVKRTL